MKNGVEWYTEASVRIFFPEGDVRCTLCPMLETYARKQCRLTGEYIADGYLCGGRCPLEFNVRENDENVQIPAFEG